MPATFGEIRPREQDALAVARGISPVARDCLLVDIGFRGCIGVWSTLKSKYHFDR